MVKLAWLNGTSTFKDWQNQSITNTGLLRELLGSEILDNLTKVRPLFLLEDLINPHYWSCSLLIILTNQIVYLHSTTWYFGSFDLLIWSAWVDYMPEMTWKCNKRLSSSSKYCCTAVCLKYTIWLVLIIMQYANTIIQSSLEHDQWWRVIRSSIR